MKAKSILSIVVITIISFGLSGVFAKISKEESDLKEYAKWFAKFGIYLMNNNEDEPGMYRNITYAHGNRSEVYINSLDTDIEVKYSSEDEIRVQFYDYFSQSNEPVIEGLLSWNSNSFDVDLTKVKKNNSVIKINTGFLNFNADSRSPVATIQIPKGIKRLIIQTTSGDIKINEISLDTLEINSASAEVDINSSRIKDFKHTSVSGDLEVSGNIEKLKSQTVSGNLKFISDLQSPELQFTTTSGDAKVTFLKTPDVSINFDTTSGDIHFDYDLLKAQADTGTHQYKLGKGQALMKFETVSGDVNISLH